MARLLFGGGLADWTFIVGDGDTAVLAAEAVVTFWNQESGGTRFLDLTDLGGSGIDQISSSNGSSGWGKGQIPPFYGPDGVFSMWADANGGSGPRALMTAANLGEYLGPMRSQLDSHMAASNLNPHGTSLASLADVLGAAAGTAGQLLGKDTDGKWKPTDVPGVSGTMQLAGDQAVTGQKTFENQGAPAAARVIVNAAAAQTSDVVQVWSPAGVLSEGGVKQKTVFVAKSGELRLKAAKADSTAVKISAQPAQSGHVLQQLDAADAVQSWWEADGSWRAPNLGRSVMMSKTGNVAVGVGTFAWYNDSGVTMRIRSVRATVNTAPTGAALIVDVNRNGTTIFGTQANRPTIAAAAKTSGKMTGMSVTTIPDGQSITVDVDQIGSTIAGADLVVQIDIY